MRLAFNLPLLATALLVIACGGPSVAKLHQAHAGETVAQIDAAFGKPENTENLPSQEGAPRAERRFFTKAHALGVADDGGFVVVEFENGKEDRMYELDAQQYKKLFPEE